MLHSLSLFIAGSTSHRPRPSSFCVAHCKTASPAVPKVGNKNRSKLPISANLNYNGAFGGQKVAPEGAALWQQSLCLELQEGSAAHELTEVKEVAGMCLSHGQRCCRQHRVTATPGQHWLGRLALNAEGDKVISAFTGIISPNSVVE